MWHPIYFCLYPLHDSIVPCGSHFWGDPDLPRGYDYPRFCDEEGDLSEYQFVCQINLSEVAPYDVSRRLPRRGLLSFFAKIDYYLGRFDRDCCLSGFVGEPSDVCVLFFPEVGSPGYHAGFEKQILLDDNDRRINPRGLPIGFSCRAEGGCEEHALLAAPTHREWVSWEAPYEDWVILLQVDSFCGRDFCLNFMDLGVLDFLISPDDLASGRFDRVRAIVLST